MAKIPITFEEYDKYNKIVTKQYGSAVAKKVDDSSMFWENTIDQSKVAFLEKLNGSLNFQFKTGKKKF